MENNDSDIILFGENTLNIRILKTIAELSEKSENGATRPKKIADVLVTEAQYIRVRLNDLRKMGLVKNVFYGHWKLTPKGRESLQASTK